MFKYRNQLSAFTQRETIQLFGCLMIVEKSSSIITFVSENISAYSSISPSEILGQNIHHFFWERYGIQFPSISDEDEVEVIPLNCKVTGENLKFEFTIYQTDQFVVLEIFPVKEVDQYIEMMNHLNLLITKVSKASDLSALYSLIVEEVYKLTDFDRVIICRFDEGRQGSVVAEKTLGQFPPYDASKLPSGDFIVEDRHISEDYLLQIIADVDYIPSEITSLDQREVPSNMLRRTILQSPSEDQLTYLKSLGVKTYLGIAILKEGRLWGLIACHHFTEKKISQSFKSVAQILGKVLTSFIVNHMNLEDYSQSFFLLENFERIQQMITDTKLLWETLVMEAPKIFAGGAPSSFAMRYKGKWTLLGETPSKEEILHLVSQLKKKSLDEEVYLNGRGVLAINFPHGQDNFIIWFRNDVNHGWKANEIEIAKKLKRFIVEFELKQQYEEFEILANTVEHFIWISAADGKPIYYNQKWFEVTGLSRDFQDEQYQKGLYIHPDDLPRLRNVWYQALSSGEGYSIEMRIRDKNNKYRWILNRIVPAKNAQGEIIRWYGSGTDIDHIKKIEQDLKDALSVRDEFISLASHELKTPITSLNLLLELSQRYLRKSNVADNYMDRALKELRRLRFLVDELLDVSKISVGKMDLEFEQKDLSKIVYEVLERYQTDSRITPVIESFKDHPPIMIECDEFRIEQVVTNLISNALKYGEEKPIEVSVAEEGGEVTLKVSDQGPGIPPEAHQKIFERFERVLPHRGISGLGLGLYISKSIVDAHQGTIAVASWPGQGATFIVKLPRQIS